MLPTGQTSEPGSCKIPQPMTPPDQKSIVWELGNIPVLPGFYAADKEKQPNFKPLPRIQTTDPDLNVTHVFSPFIPGLTRRHPPQSFKSRSKPRKVLPVSSPEREHPHSQLYSLSPDSPYGLSPDSTPPNRAEYISEDTWRELQWKIHNAVGFDSERKAIAKPLVCPEKDGEGE